MRISNLLGAALALVLVPGVAAAQSNNEEQCPPSACEQGTIDSSGNCVCPDMGGSGSLGTDEGAAMPEGESDARSGAVGGSATSPSAPSSGATASPNVTVINAPEEGQAREDKDDPQGFTVTLNGGVEGYTSSLAPRINAGPSWGLTLGANPTPIVGLELSYVGATNAVTDPVVGDNDTRIIRNGGNVDIKLSAPLPLAPYVFGGVGISRATVQNDAGGYGDDTFGQIPLGGGVEWHIGDFTAGARFTYNYLFDRGFTPLTRQGQLGFDEKQFGDSYNAHLQLGGTF